MNPPIWQAALTQRRVFFALLVVTASTAFVMTMRSRSLPASVARSTKGPLRASPTPVPPSGIPVYHPTLRFVRGRIEPASGVVRDVRVSVSRLWRLADENWIPLESAHGAVVVPSRETRAITDLVAAGMPDGEYAAQLTINGRAECYRFVLPDHPLECGTSWLPGSHAIRERPLPTACTGQGFLEEVRPEGGSGVVTRFLEDSRIREQVPMRDGRPDGVAVEFHRLSDGAPTHIERTYVRGELTLSRFFDLAGWQMNELPYAQGRPHGTFRAWNAAGQVVEETVWNHGAVVSARTLDDHGHVVSSVEYGMPGRDHGIYCRPDHHCSGW